MFKVEALPQMPDSATEAHVMAHHSDLVHRCKPGSLAHGLARGLDVVRKAIGLKHRSLRMVPAAAVAIPLLMLLCRRLDRLLGAFARTVERGTPPPPRASRSKPRPEPQAEPQTELQAEPPEAQAAATPAAAAPPPERVRFPVSVLWLRRLVPEALRGRDWISDFLASPALVAQLAITPQAGRPLRAICRLLAIKPPEHLRLPRRPRRQRPATDGLARTRRRRWRRRRAASTSAPAPASPSGLPPQPDFSAHRFAPGSLVLTPSLALGPGATRGPPPERSLGFGYTLVETPPDGPPAEHTFIYRKR